jgi:hypothetical protein
MELGNLFFGNSRGEFEVDHDWQDAFVGCLYDMGFDNYGYPKYEEKEYKGEFKTIKSNVDENDFMSYFENDTFILMPYYWGEDDYICELSNFVHKPSGFKMQWYKYPLRDAYMNKDISFDELVEIMEDCKRSLGITGISYYYKEAMGYIEQAIYMLSGIDNKKKTRDICKKLKKIIEDLKSDGN